MKKERKSLKFDGEKLFLQVEQYRNNGNLAILAYTDEELYGDITVNLPGFSIDKDKGFINSMTKSSGLEQELIKNGIIEEVIGTVEYNMGKYDFVIFNMEELKKYDLSGVKKYQTSLGIEEDEEIE